MSRGPDRSHSAAADPDVFAVADWLDPARERAGDLDLDRVTADQGLGRRVGLVESGDVVVVGVGQQDRRDSPAALAGGREQAIDFERRIDQRGLAGDRTADHLTKILQ